MKKLRKPRWMTDEQWQGYLKHVAEESARLLVLLRRKLAEARADLEADCDDPDLARWHAARISILLCQIADAEGTAPYQQEPERPVIVNAVRSRRRRDKPDTDFSPIHASMGVAVQVAVPGRNPCRIR